MLTVIILLNQVKTGSRNMNPNKYKDDAELLRNAYYEANDGFKRPICFLLWSKLF